MDTFQFESDEQFVDFVKTQRTAVRYNQDSFTWREMQFNTRYAHYLIEYVAYKLKWTLDEIDARCGCDEKGGVM